MFSGIVEEVGSILELKDSAEGRRIRIGAKKVLAKEVLAANEGLAGGLALGDSLSVVGACLTVVDYDDVSFSVEAVHETLRRTKLGGLQCGSRVNLERALKLTDRLDGHMVTGHIDTTACVKSIVCEGFSRWITFELDHRWSPLFVEKGSVTVDGVSLTIASCDDILSESGIALDAPPFVFSVALIPFTLEHTTLGTLVIGDTVNIETDIVARYVARWLKPSLKQNLSLPAEQISTAMVAEKHNAISEPNRPIQLL